LSASSRTPQRRLSDTIYTGTNITDVQLAEFKLFSQYAGAAYCNGKAAAGSAITCGGGVCPDVTASDAKIVTSFRYGPMLLYPWFQKPSPHHVLTMILEYSGRLTDIEGFVATDPARQLVILSFRGTASIKAWIVK
jgi:hypothetical protein